MGTGQVEDPFNGLTNAEAERLALVMEEMGEAIQVIGKILRHGYQSQHPVTGESNRLLLTKELGDVMAVVRLMFVFGDIHEGRVEEEAISKANRVKKFLHHQQFAKAPDDLS